MVSRSAEPAPWETTGKEKRESVRRLFAEIAGSYDRFNSLLSLQAHHRWRTKVVRSLNLKVGERALDVCCGTGDFALELQKTVQGEGLVLGIDFCAPMLQVASGKGVSSLGMGDACKLPVQSDSFDAITVGWGIRNVSDIDEAHREIARVLKPGGRFVSLEMAKPQNRVLRVLSSIILKWGSPLVGRLFGKKNAYQYLPMSTERFWSREELAESMRKAGFQKIRTRDFMLGNICMHWGQKG